jgi:hypothetical protein
MLDEVLLPQDSSLRAKGLLDIFVKLDAVGKPAFKQMLFFKRGYQMLVELIVKDQSDDEDDEDAQAKRKQIIAQLVKLLPGENELAKKIWDKLANLKDKDSNKVIRILNTALNPNTDFKTITELKGKASTDNLVGDTKDIKDLMSAIVARTAYTFINCEIISQLLGECEKYVQDKKEEDWKKQTLDRLELLETVATYFAYLFEDSLTKIQEMLNNEDPDINVALLKVALYAFDKLEEREASMDNSQVAT